MTEDIKKLLVGDEVIYCVGFSLLTVRNLAGQ